MRKIDGGRRLQAFGPCDAYGDPLPDGVARLDLVYKAQGAEHHIVIDRAEAVMLRDELERALDQIDHNRAVKRRGPLPTAAEVRGILKTRR